MMVYKKYAFAVSFAACVLLAGCGTSDEDAVPGATIEISPSDLSVDADATVAGVLLPKLYVVTVKRGSVPLSGTNVDLVLSFPFLTFLDDNGGPQVSPFSTTTDVNGNVSVSVVYPLGGGTAFEATFEAFSGAAYATSTITVTCSDADGVGVGSDC